MANSSSTINLINNKQVSLFDKFIDWALTTGRLIVIVTEIVAISAFIYRISLDRRLEDIQAQIDQRQALISTLRDDEIKYRNLQDRIALSSTFSENSFKKNKIIQEIVNLIPQEAIINDLTFDIDKININISVTSTSSLSDFINPLKNYPEIKSISIDNIENIPSNGLLVDITTILK